MCTGVFITNALKRWREPLYYLHIYIFLVVRICTDFDHGFGYFPLTLVQKVSYPSKS